MSCYEWEAGTITLPTKEAVRVRDAVKAAVEKHTTTLYDTAQRFWKECPAAYKRDEKRYRKAVNAFLGGNVRTSDRDWFPDGAPDPKLPAWRGLANQDDYNTTYGDLSNLLNYYTAGEQRRVQKPDVVRLIGKSTGTKFTVQVGEPSITFDGRTVTWDVPENNHACDHAREHPIAQAFFHVLGTVKWTRGSGGDIVGNNEYSRDSRDEGGGGNYLVAHYGPQPARRSRRSVAAWRP